MLKQRAVFVSKGSLHMDQKEKEKRRRKARVGQFAMEKSLSGHWKAFCAVLMSILWNKELTRLLNAAFLVDFSWWHSWQMVLFKNYSPSETDTDRALVVELSTSNWKQELYKWRSSGKKKKRQTYVWRTCDKQGRFGSVFQSNPETQDFYFPFI